MEKNTKYPEIDPSLNSVRILQGHLKNEKICIASYFEPVHSNKPQVYLSVFGRTKQVALNQGEEKLFPSRNEFNKKVHIKHIKKIPVIIQREFKPQVGLMLDNSPGELVLILQLFNFFDNCWDYIYILIDKNLINSINSKIKISGLIVNQETNWQNQVKSYFTLIYPLLNHFSEIGNHKLEYTKELISTLERSIVYNQQLLSEISLLKQKEENNIVEVINELAYRESQKLGKEIKISGNSIDYILHHKGNEQKLKDAFVKAVRIANLIATSKNINSLVIEPEFIQVNEGPEELKNTRLNPKRVEKAEFILKRYEESAQRSQNVGKKITINSIAQHVLPKSISPPAVSDSVKKYKTEIIYLLDTKKSDWILLRTYFGPIVSLSKRPINQPHE